MPATLCLRTLVVAVLSATVLCSCQTRKDKERILRDDLFILRSVIDQYTMDKAKAPQSLDDLVEAGYLKQIPVDPMTGRRDTWVPEKEDTPLRVDQQQMGIIDVHSGSHATSSEGTPYSSW
jgi:general secretion pathway protein G